MNIEQVERPRRWADAEREELLPWPVLGAVAAVTVLLTAWSSGQAHLDRALREPRPVVTLDPVVIYGTPLRPNAVASVPAATVVR